MRILFSALLIAVGASLTYAAAAEDLLKQAKLWESRSDPGQALAFYLRLEVLEPGRADLLQKIARQYSDLAEQAKNPKDHRDRLERALSYAERAVQLDPNNAVNVLSLAICHGKLAACSEIRTKIAYSRLVKEESERALALDPRYAWANHILGCWNYEVASLPGPSRMMAQIFYGGLPPASYDEAIRYLKRAVDLEPRDPAHRIELGFAYRAAGNPQAARIEFERGLAMPSLENFDREAQIRARSALAGP